VARGSPISFARRSPRRPQHRGAQCRSSAPHLATRPLLRALLLPRSASRSSVLLSVSSFGPSSLARLLRPLLTSDSASADLSICVAQRHAVSSPRVLRTNLHAYARRLYVTAFRTRFGLCIFWPAHPAGPPLSASCSSRQRFASGFLRTSSRPENPCLPLTLPRVGCVEDFHLQVGAPCRAHQKKKPRASGAPVSRQPRRAITSYRPCRARGRHRPALSPASAPRRSSPRSSARDRPPTSRSATPNA